MRALILLAVGWSLAGSQANAFTGTDLYNLCSEKRIEGYCLSYVRGFMDGMTLGRAAGQRGPGIYCPPNEGMSVDQTRLIVEKYLRDHPEKLHQDAALLAAEAIIRAFPCTRNSN
jgi:hypothetical protein